MMNRRFLQSVKHTPRPAGRGQRLFATSGSITTSGEGEHGIIPRLYFKFCGLISILFPLTRIRKSFCSYDYSLSLQGEGKSGGFTLAELLIALAILGVIATFTIPKILDSGSDSKFNSIAKEAVSMVSGAYQSYKLNSGPSTSASISDLMPYMNYVSVDTTSSVDSYQNDTTRACGLGGTHYCLLLHNGARMYFLSSGVSASFGDSSSTSAIWFLVDPDGKITTTGVANTPGKAVQIWLYYNGRITTRGNMLANSYHGTSGPHNPDAASDPPWFSWSN